MAAAEPAPHRATASKSGAAKKPPARGGAAGDADLTAVPTKGTGTAPTGGAKSSRSGTARTSAKTASPKTASPKTASPKSAGVKGPANTTKTGTKPANVGAPAAEVEVEEAPELEGGPAVEDLADVEVEEITADAEEVEAQSGPGGEDFVWDEEESEALRQARKDAELTASADSVRAYLKQIGKVALLNAEEEVELAKRIEAG
ncbi:MAG: sigma-70 factor domain-containing protein, partial [Pseudonocardiaceae bacterium]